MAQCLAAADNRLAMDKYYHGVRRENRKTALTPRSRPGRICGTPASSPPVQSAAIETAGAAPDVDAGQHAAAAARHSKPLRGISLDSAASLQQDNAWRT